MTIVDEINQSWGWVGISAAEVVGENDFGNLMVRDKDGKYWRLCPEDVYCEVVAATRSELDALSHNQEFLHDWYMKALVDEAEQKLGKLPEGRKYCLKVPGVLGGTYGGDNLGTVPLVELIRFSGDLGRQIRDLPDGAQVKFTVKE
jgi:hypothetical protein